MSDHSDEAGGEARALQGLLSRAVQAGPAPPVDQWHPPDCGPIPMRIARDGTWHYGGSPINRAPMVRLFASLLRREADGRFVLVTPVEMVTIEVEDVPFLAVEMAWQEGDPPALVVRTNLGDAVTVDADHPLRFRAAEEAEAFIPYVHVRRGLDARFTRALALDLAEFVEHADGTLGVRSAGTFFKVKP